MVVKPESKAKEGLRGNIYLKTGVKSSALGLLNLKGDIQQTIEW